MIDQKRVIIQILSGFWLCFSLGRAMAYPLADNQGVIYQGLQDINAIAAAQGINPADKLPFGPIADMNAYTSLMAPWNAEAVNRALAGFGVIPETLVTKVSSKAASTEYFDASGRQLTRNAVDRIESLIRNGQYLNRFSEEARAITIDDTDALFTLSDLFITKNLAGAANTASDQKSSSTVIPANTPVFVVGQLRDIQGVNPAHDSWLVVWRPEFGLKFVRSRHVASLSENDFELYRDLASTHQLTVSHRIEASIAGGGHRQIMYGTPVLQREDEDGYILASRGEGSRAIHQLQGRVDLELYLGAMSTYDLSVIDPGQQLEDHLATPPMEINAGNFLSVLHNTIFRFPAYAFPNINNAFAWGEGIVGPDNLHGQDISNFIYKLMLPFGTRLPRHSADQVNKGLGIFKMDLSLESLDDRFKRLARRCTLGRFVSFGKGSNMVCLGSLTVNQIANLDQRASAEARVNGLGDEEKVPLVAASPVGLKDVTTGEWSITGKTAVYPLFKHAPFNSWISREELYIYSFFIQGKKK